ncbi:hypothetical protein RRG08_023734 [Elysia crispata]|uniref:Uncharacterized protein n=1 Tax=Elysia crispata TaxID=231223 RepID=A0AAE0ZWV0_9GAST|nr:hypothetical protein RRG08_023734 [Elysia crispata]
MSLGAAGITQSVSNNEELKKLASCIQYFNFNVVFGFAHVTANASRTEYSSNFSESMTKDLRAAKVWNIGGASAYPIPSLTASRSIARVDHAHPQ